MDRSVNVQTSEDSATGEKNLVITLSGKNGLTPDQQKEILTAINEGNDNQFETSETSAVEPYIGAKALKIQPLPLCCLSCLLWYIFAFGFLLWEDLRPVLQL